MGRDDPRRPGQESGDNPAHTISTCERTAVHAVWAAGAKQSKEGPPRPRRAGRGRSQHGGPGRPPWAWSVGLVGLALPTTFLHATAAHREQGELPGPSSQTCYTDLHAHTHETTSFLLGTNLVLHQTYEPAMTGSPLSCRASNASDCCLVVGYLYMEDCYTIMFHQPCHSKKKSPT